MKVEFVKYTGKYPNYCRGTFTVKIDGKNVAFGSDGEFDSFWHSGGCVYFDESWNAHVDEGSWIFSGDDFPPEYVDYYNEICDEFQNNVSCGCCGGCI